MNPESVINILVEVIHSEKSECSLLSDDTDFFFTVVFHCIYFVLSTRNLTAKCNVDCVLPFFNHSTVYTCCYLYISVTNV